MEIGIFSSVGGGLDAVVADAQASADDLARANAAKTFLIYGQLPSDRAMLDHEGLGGPEDLAPIGDEATCVDRMDELVAAGVTQFAASEFASSPEDRARTRAFLATRI
jgi:hypothetical protein